MDGDGDGVGVGTSKIVEREEVKLTCLVGRIGIGTTIGVVSVGCGVGGVGTSTIPFLVFFLLSITREYRYGHPITMMNTTD